MAHGTKYASQLTLLTEKILMTSTLYEIIACQPTEVKANEVHAHGINPVTEAITITQSSLEAILFYKGIEVEINPSRKSRANDG